jgi:heme-degrading monooxygenase HmoA
MYVQLFEGWRYREGARARLVAMGLGGVPQAAPRPDVPGLIARLLATDPADPDTGIGVWVWESEAACRAYEANRPEAVHAAVAADVDDSRLVERTFDALFFGARVPTD